jgi:hypothetical protein
MAAGARGTLATGWTAAAALAVVAAVAGLWLAEGRTLEGWYAAFVLLAGLATGSLGLLMIGHLMSEEWLTPIRAEAEAAALTTPLLLAMALPLAFSLADLYPWASANVGLPTDRAAFLSTSFFIGRAILYLAVWTALAIWIIRTRHLRRTSAIGLALLAPTMSMAAMDWVLSREPAAWFGLFGFAFGTSQLLAALAGGILVSLLSPEHPSAVRMQSLERALLTLALLVLWTWFSQFLIVWLANLPNEAAWYLDRMQRPYPAILAAAALSLLGAVVILVPPGFGRRTMIAGSGLLLVSDAALMIWILGPPGGRDLFSVPATVAMGALCLAWALWFGAALGSRRKAEQRREEGPQFATR